MEIIALKPRNLSKKNTPEKNLEAMVLAKKKMEEKDFSSSTLHFALNFSRWNDLRLYLLEKKMIEKQHITYTWIGAEPTIEMGLEFALFYLKRCDESRNPKDKKITEESAPKDIYTDYLKLKKHNQELTAQNGKLCKELKKTSEKRKNVAEKLTNFIQSDKVSKFKTDLREFESALDKYDLEKVERNRKLYTEQIDVLSKDKQVISEALMNIAYNQFFKPMPKDTRNKINGKTVLEYIESSKEQRVISLESEIKNLKVESQKKDKKIEELKERIEKGNEICIERFEQIQILNNALRKKKEEYKIKESDLRNMLHDSSNIRREFQKKIEYLERKVYLENKDCEQSSKTISLLGIKVCEIKTK
jgi:anti-sigma28 factor (negative regulator of flagellin synthesis)